MKAACPRCQKASPLQFNTKDLNRRITIESFDYYRCPDCAIIFLSPVPADIGKHYQSDYYDIPDSITKLADGAERERFKIELVQQFANGGQLLEIGPAWGNFAYLAKQAGFKVDAIEMSDQCCNFLNSVVGIRAIHASSIESALHSADIYDVIVLWHVIEHLPDPWATLGVIEQRLKSGGILIIAAPSPDAFQFRVLGGLWAHVDAPRHLELIPSATLLAHGRQLGLTKLLVTSTDKGSLGWNAFGWAVSLANLSRNRYISRLLHISGRIISRILAPIESREGKGSAYTVVLQKGGYK